MLIPAKFYFDSGIFYQNITYLLQKGLSLLNLFFFKFTNWNHLKFTIYETFLKRQNSFQLRNCLASCMLTDNIMDYFFVAQGKTTIPGVDDAEELELTDVRFSQLL